MIMRHQRTIVRFSSWRNKNGLWQRHYNGWSHQRGPGNGTGAGSDAGREHVDPRGVHTGERNRGGGHWESLGNGTQAAGQFVDGDYYRIFSTFGCLFFKKVPDTIWITLSYNTAYQVDNIRYCYLRYSLSSGELLVSRFGLSVNASELSVEHWVPDA